MHSIKGLLFSLIGLFAVVTLFSLLMPSKVMTVRSVLIHAPKDKVFEEMADLKKWEKWHPVFMQVNQSIQFSNPSYGKDAFAEWTSSAHKNTFRITQVSPEGMHAVLSRTGEKDMDNILTVTTMKDSNHVEVEWKVMTKLKWYPWDKFSGIFVDKMAGPGYETALNNLKELFEGKPEGQ